MKSDYTYDFNGKIMAIAGFNPDNLPKLPPNRENSIRFKFSDLLNNQALRHFKKNSKKNTTQFSE